MLDIKKIKEKVTVIVPSRLQWCITVSPANGFNLFRIDFKSLWTMQEEKSIQTTSEPTYRNLKKCALM